MTYHRIPDIERAKDSSTRKPRGTRRRRRRRQRTTTTQRHNVRGCQQAAGSERGQEKQQDGAFARSPLDGACMHWGQRSGRREVCVCVFFPAGEGVLVRYPTVPLDRDGHFKPSEAEKEKSSTKPTQPHGST